jgi:DNA-binding transcriptional LysR family regulator
MLNIPTDLLRTLIAVVDMRSFTKAAQSLGITQPAVSAQIKRLQSLLGFDLLDKTASGVILTIRGEAVVAQARRLLSINDEIVRSSAGPLQTLRVGIPGDFAGSRLPATLARIRLRWPGIAFHVGSGTSEILLRQLQQGEFDVILAVSEAEPTIEPRHSWKRQAVWVRSDATKLDLKRPVPLVCYADDCACQRVAVTALQRAGQQYEFVYTSRSLVSLEAAVAAGFGIMVMPFGRAKKSNLVIWNDSPLPRLPELNCGIFAREGSNRTVEELADYLAADLQVEWPTPSGQAPAEVTPLRASGTGF